MEEKKLHFPDFFAVKIWVLTQVSTERIPPKDVDLGPELRERQARIITCWHGQWTVAPSSLRGRGSPQMETAFLVTDTIT